MLKLHHLITGSTYVDDTIMQEFVNKGENRDYFMVGECIRFLFTSCEGSLNERVSAANE